MDSSQEAELSAFFTPQAYLRRLSTWRNITTEKRARSNQSSHLFTILTLILLQASDLLLHVLHTVEILFSILDTPCEQASPYPIPDTRTFVDYCVEVELDSPDHTGRVLIEVMAPSIMNLLDTPPEGNVTQNMDLEDLKNAVGKGFGHVCHSIKYKPNGKVFEIAIRKVITDHSIGVILLDGFI